MYYLLISLNILLAAFVAHLFVTFPSTEEMLASKPKSQPVRHSHGSTRTVSASVQPAAKVLESPAVTEERIATVVKRNIFDTERVPEAPASKSARNAQARQQVRAEMQLVGTFTVGDSVGAIIHQRLQGSAQQIKELLQKEAEKNTTSSPRVTDPKKIAAGEGGEAPAAATAAGETKPKTVVAGNPAPSTSNTSTLYLKVGETTVAGYKLVEVTEKTAVLTKNSERVELKLLPASDASSTVARQQNNRNNQNNNNNNNNRNNQQANNNNNNNNNRNNQQASNNNNRNNQNNNNNNNNRNQQNNNRNNNNNNRNNQNNNNRNNNNNNRR